MGAWVARALAAMGSIAILAMSAHAGAATIEVRPHAALHQGTIAAKRVTWRTTFALPSTPCERGDATIALAFALPLEAEITQSPYVRASSDRRFLVLDCASIASATSVAFTTTMKLERSSSRVVMTPPLFAGDGVQIVSVDGEDETRFEPEARAGYVRQIGFFATDDVNDEARADCDRRTGAITLKLFGPTYLRVNDRIREEGGIAGRLSTSADRTRPAVISLAIGFALGLGALALVHRRLTRTVRIERAEASLREAYERLE